MNRYRALMLTATTDYANLDQLEKLAETIPNMDYAIILHDKDTGTDHYHMSMYFKHATTIEAVAKKLNVKPNFIQKWDKRTNNLWNYLIHNTNEAHNTKADYTDYINNADKFRTNLPDFGALTTRDSSGRRGDEVIRKILLGIITKKELLSPDLIEFYYKNIHKIDNAIRLRTESLKYNPPNCKTIYIYGKGGTGKTTEAIKIAQTKYPNSYTIASSSNDPLQDYTGEKCVIFDDFRPQNYDFIELLGLLDPYYRQRTHKSRYYNKPLATELIIITTTQSIDELLRYYQNMNVREDIFQLKRRIETVIYIDESHETHTTVLDDQSATYVAI